MPTVTLNKTVLERLAGKKLPLDKLKDRISFLGTHLEAIENDQIHVEVFPNRPDMLSEQGFARAFSSFIGVKKGLRKYPVKKSNYKVVVENSVRNVRPYTVCAVVKNLKFNDETIREVIQLQEKLHTTYGRNRRKVAMGIYPFEKIMMPIRYMAKKPDEIQFRPLDHPKELTGQQILSQHSVGREYKHLLEGQDKFPIFVDASDKVLSMPPIINSHDIGKISESTKEVFIECSGFDLRVLSICLNMVVTALADIGGDIYSVDMLYKGKRFTAPMLDPAIMKIDISYINKLLGLGLKEADIKRLLERMGYGYKNKKAYVPAYRADVLHQVDLAEDIAIAHGYENFEEMLPEVPAIAQEAPIEIFKNRLAELLVGLGLLETSTYSLTNRDIQTSKMNHEIEVIEISNSLSEEYNCVRAWMLPSLIEVLSRNKNVAYPHRLFESGVVFKKNPNTETNVEETCRLAVASCHEKADFTEIKQILDYIMRALNVSYEIEEAEHGSFLPGRAGRVSVAGRKIAYIGEIAPQVLVSFGLEFPVAALELNINELYGLLTNNLKK